MLVSPVAVDLSGYPVGDVIRFEQTKAFSRHSVAVLDLSYATGSRRAHPVVAPEWTPVVVGITNTVSSAQWFGYVHHGGISSDIRDLSGPIVRYTLIGTSLPMNQERTRSWRSVSASAVVRQIAKEHRLRTVISPVRRAMGYYAQPGNSDWKVLQDLASTVGYRLLVDGSTVMFVDPKILLRGVAESDVPTFTQSRRPGMVDTLYEFVSKVGTMVPRANGSTARQVVSGLDPRTGRTITASRTQDLGTGTVNSVPTLTKINTGVRVGSATQAQSLVDAAALNTQGWVTATAVVVGSPDLVPGSIVNFAGATVPADQRGLWLVTSVTHRVLRDGSNPTREFTTTVEVERDQYYAPRFTTDVKTINTRDSVSATIRNGVIWESEFMEDINVG